MTDIRLSRESATRASVPIVVGTAGSPLVLRPPRLLDGPSWRATNLRDESDLRPAFGHRIPSWSRSVSHQAWADRVISAEAGAEAGSLVSFVVEWRGAVEGEISYQVDPRNGLVELSTWMSRSVPRELRRWSSGFLLERVLSLPEVSGVVAPVSLANPRPVDMLQAFGFVRRATVKGLRPYDGCWSDHDIWWLAGNRSSVTLVAAEVAASSHAAEHGSSTVESPRRARDAVTMVAPAARARLCAFRRRRRGPARQAIDVDVEGRTVTLRLGGSGLVEVDGTHVGVADLRHDAGTNALEAWAAVLQNDVVSADAIVVAAIDIATTRGARRVSWIARRSSVEARAVERAGFTWEGLATPPVDAPDGTYGLWGLALAAQPS